MMTDLGASFGSNRRWLRGRSTTLCHRRGSRGWGWGRGRRPALRSPDNKPWISMVLGGEDDHGGGGGGLGGGVRSGGEDKPRSSRCHAAASHYPFCFKHFSPPPFCLVGGVISLWTIKRLEIVGDKTRVLRGLDWWAWGL